MFYSLQKTHSLHCMVGLSSWKWALLLIFIMTRQKVEQRVTTKWFGVSKGTEAAAFASSICSHFTLSWQYLRHRAAPALEFTLAGEGNRCPRPRGHNCCASGAGFKQSAQELGLKYWGAHAGNNVHIMDRNLNHAGGFSWQILAKFSGLNCKLSKELSAGWRYISVST